MTHFPLEHREFMAVFLTAFTRLPTGAEGQDQLPFPAYIMNPHPRLELRNLRQMGRCKRDLRGCSGIKKVAKHGRTGGLATASNCNVGSPGEAPGATHSWPLRHARRWNWSTTSRWSRHVVWIGRYVFLPRQQRLSAVPFHPTRRRGRRNPVRAFHGVQARAFRLASARMIPVRLS